MIDTLPPSSFPRSAEVALFAPRADGGPLMVWQVGNGLRSARSSPPTGASATAPRALPFDAQITQTSAVYVGGAFYVVASVRDVDVGTASAAHGPDRG